MRRKVVLLGVLCLFVLLRAEAQETVPLPVRKVVLYKNGMGYFEHLGQVRDARTVEIVLPSSQLNDVLKSLTVIDLGRGQVSGVTYDSAAPLDRRLAELPIDLGSAQGIVGLLNQIRGTEVEIRAPGGPVTGKLMGAEIRRHQTGPNSLAETVEVLIFTPQGEIRSIELASAGALRLVERELAGDVSRYLELLDSAHQRDVRRLRIQSVGSGARQLYVSYTSEAPIWKTTYRIVLDEKQKPLLQGWAVVDNTTSTDWTEVELSLVAGAPISFVQNLSQPLYARRPVIPLPQGFQVTPQMHEATLETARGETRAGEENKEEEGAQKAERRQLAMARPAEAAPRAGIAGLSGGVVGGRLGEVMRAQAPETARAQVLGDQFEYRLRQPVTIRRNQSALLPIVHSDIEGEKVSVFNEATGDRRPRLAVWLKNSTGLTLDAGSFTVIDSNAFAGEGLTETINNQERRLLSYALDLGVEVSTNRGTEQERVERLEILRGMMRLHSKVVEKRTYVIRNNSDKTRAVVVEHPVRPNWTLIETTKPAESSSSYHRFRVETQPKATTELAVREENPLQTTYDLRSITSEQIVVWVRQRTVDAEIERALQRIITKKNEIEDLRKKIAALEQEQNEIFRDQSRVRENLQRMGNTPEEANLRLRYIRQLEQQENRLGSIRNERDALDRARADAQKQLDDILQNLSFDRKL